MTSAPPLPPDEELTEEQLKALVHDFELHQKRTQELKQEKKEEIVTAVTEEPSIVEKRDVIDPSKDVDNLELLENVFDKRITEKDVTKAQDEEDNKSDSSQLLKKNDIELKTELTDPEIVSIAKIRFMAEMYDIDILEQFTNNLMELKVSRFRRGRREFIQGLHADERREQPEGNILSRIFNRGGSQ